MYLRIDVLTSPNSWNLDMQSNQQDYSTIITGGKSGKFKVGFTFILVQYYWVLLVKLNLMRPNRRQKLLILMRLV